MANKSNIIKEKVGSDSGAYDEKLTTEELELMKTGLNEALLIKDGKLKSIPYSKLWKKVN